MPHMHMQAPPMQAHTCSRRAATTLSERCEVLALILNKHQHATRGTGVDLNDRGTCLYMSL